MIPRSKLVQAVTKKTLTTAKRAPAERLGEVLTPQLVTALLAAVTPATGTLVLVALVEPTVTADETATALTLETQRKCNDILSGRLKFPECFLKTTVTHFEITVTGPATQAARVVVAKAAEELTVVVA